ncbi:MAG TPA: hypothetical protein VNJ01_04245 [Bacteriovoracaceae bacterium]|nr:hypothetical protein [Bacteriovoracaceae bacterium]
MQNDFNLSERIKYFSKEAKNFWGKISKNDFELAKTKYSEVKGLVQERLVESKETLSTLRKKAKDSRRVKPVEDTEDESTGVKYATTENSPLANGAEKVAAHGIDSFGEQDTFDPEAVDENQTFRDRKQNSDLAERYYTPGLQSNNKTH